MDITKNFIFMAAVNNAGNDAFAPITNAKLFSGVEPWLNIATPIKSRWLPTPELENLTDVRGETVFQTFNSGKKQKVRDGFRDVYAFIPKGDAELYGRLKNLGACNEIGAMAMDQSSNLIGSKRTQNTLPLANIYPILIDRGSWDVQFVKSTDSEVQGIAIMFQWKSTEQDEDLIMIPSSELDWSREDLYGLLDVYGLEISTGQTSMVVDLFTKTASSEVVPITGLLSTNFQLYNVTGSASVAVVSSLEDTNIPGRYTITYASQTLADVLRLSVAKDRYDSANAEGGLEDVVFNVV